MTNSEFKSHLFGHAPQIILGLTGKMDLGTSWMQ